MSEIGSAANSRAVLERLMEIIRNREYDKLEEVLHPDFVQEIPQSSEKVVGIEAFRKILEHFPDMGRGANIEVAMHPYIAGGQDHYVLTPTFNVVKVADSGEELTSYVESRYPDGSQWFIVTFSSFRDGLITKRVDFFAPFFDPPEWRAEWVQRLV